MEKILKKSDLGKWVAKLTGFDLYGPVRENDHWEFIKISHLESFPEDYTQVNVPLKKVVLPNREVLFQFEDNRNGGPHLQEVLPEEKEVIVFGVRPCDAQGIALLSKVFSGGIPDIYFERRREQVYVVGLSCYPIPEESCFCLSVGGGPFSTQGMDILLSDLRGSYFVEILTPKGEKLIRLGQEYFSDPTDKDRHKKKQLEKRAREMFARQIQGVEKIPPVLQKMFEAGFWREESFRCLKCGICTYLCPTCHCFDIADELSSPAPLQGKRVRIWDTCQFPDFTMHSSGHNPRPDKASRLRQRIMHKFLYFVETFDDIMCTGCGRCVAKCPVGIDIIDILNKVASHGA
jgi:ferredoxin